MFQQIRTIFISLVLILAGAFVTYAGFNEKAKFDRLTATGKTTEGYIVSGEERPGRRGAKKYYLDVQYVPGDDISTQRVDFKVSQDFYEAHIANETNRKVMVRYNPNNFSEAIIEGGYLEGELRLRYIGPVLVFIGLGFSAFFLRKKKLALSL